MEQGLTLLILLIFGSLCLVALFVVVNVLFQGFVSGIRLAAHETPGRALLVGLVNFVFLALLAMVLGRAAQNLGLQFLGLLAMLFVVLLVIGVTFGLAGMVELVAERLVPDYTGWRRTAGGAAAMTLACITPYVGWFGLLPYVGLRGLGALILSLFARASVKKVQQGGETVD
jgi:hypothetical protein